MARIKKIKDPLKNIDIMEANKYYRFRDLILLFNGEIKTDATGLKIAEGKLYRVIDKTRIDYKGFDGIIITGWKNFKQVKSKNILSIIKNF